MTDTGGAGRASERRGEGRAQAGSIGVVLLLAATVAGATAVVALGSAAIADTEGEMEVSNAEQTMAQFDSQASLVAHGTADSNEVALAGGEGSTRVRPGAGWMNVTVVNESTDAVKTVVMNETLGAVTYERDGERVAYQGGGVWRSTGGGSTMVSPPEFHYRGTTLTLPLVVVDGSGALGSRAELARVGSAEGKYPNATRSNPLTEGKVNVTVHSRYYRAWGSFFEERTGGDVTYDHAASTVTITLITPAQPRTVSSALASTAPGEDLELAGGGSDPAYTDSYNSSVGPYSVSQSTSGTIVTAGNVKTSGNAEVHGNVRAGGFVKMKGTSEVLHDVRHTTGLTQSGGSYIGGTTEQISGVESPDGIETRVRGEVDALATQNDNNGTSAVQNERLQFGADDEAELGPGAYYLTKVDKDSKNLTIDTDGNLVTIGVENGFKLHEAWNLTVEDDGKVRVYVKDDIEFKSGAEVYAAGQNATRFWVYGTSDSEIQIEGSNSATNHVSIVGVIYAPSDGGDADVSMKHADVFGGIVGGDLDVQNGGAVHYDKALKEKRALPPTSNAPRVTYLHVSTTTLNVTGA